MMLRRLAALAAVPVLAFAAAAPAMAADTKTPFPPFNPHPNYVWFCTDHNDVDLDLGGLLGLHIDLDLLHPWHGRYCGWVRVS